MKSESSFLVVLCICLMMVTPIVVTSWNSESLLISQSGHDSFVPNREVKRGYLTLAYVDHDPITISSDADFAAQGWPGSGTEADPYVIEGLRIISTETCISISGTSAYFVIRGCLLTSTSSGNGIRFFDVSNGRVENNTICNSSHEGVYLYQSSNNTLANNTFYNNAWGDVIISSSPHNTLLNNTLESGGIILFGTSVEEWQQVVAANNTVNGKPLGYFWGLTSGVIDGSQYGQVILANCTDVTVRNGVFSTVHFAIQLGFSKYCTMMNNTIINSLHDGVKLSYSTNNTLVNNTICNSSWSGVYVFNSWNNTLVNNTISKNLWGGIYLFSSGYSTLLNNALENDGVVIYGTSVEQWQHTIAPNNTLNGRPLGYFWNLTGGEIDGSWYGQVILADCTGVTVRDGLIHHTFKGIQLGFSENCTLMNNTVHDNFNDGVYLGYSSNNMLVENEISSNLGNGVFLSFSSNNTIVNNTVSGNVWRGLGLGSSWNNTLANNTIVGNALGGVSLGGSRNNTVVNNTVCQNGGEGISVKYSSDYNELVRNTVGLNSGTGIVISYSSFNLVYRNRLYSNGAGNARDDGSGNHWNTTDMGNYWSDYNGTGAYPISGSAEAFDYHPRLYDVELPTIDHPADIEYVEGTTGHAITWSPSDAHPDRYEIYRNESLIDSGDWDGGQITVDIDGLAEGVYNFTLVVYDGAENSASDTVFVVVVVDDVAPSIDHPTDIEYVEGTTGHAITWSPSDAHPDRYEIYRNGSLIDSGDWDGGQITVDIDGLAEGVYNYTLVVFDEGENRASDTVMVTVVDGTAPTIDHPADIEYVEGTTGHAITWSPSDAHPDRYEIYRNGTLIDSGEWDGGQITVDIDGLAEGVYNFTLVVFDEGGDYVLDTVIVTVVPEATTTTTGTTTSSTTTTTGTATSSTGGVSTSTEAEALAQTISIGVAAASTILVIGLIIVMLRRHGD